METTLTPKKKAARKRVTRSGVTPVAAQDTLKLIAQQRDRIEALEAEIENLQAEVAYLNSRRKPKISGAELVEQHMASEGLPYIPERFPETEARMAPVTPEAEPIDRAALLKRRDAITAELEKGVRDGIRRRDLKIERNAIAKKLDAR